MSKSDDLSTSLPARRDDDAAGDAIHASRVADHRATVAGTTRPTSRAIDSATLLAGIDELHITHGDACYRLKRTALGKLILTK